MVPSYLSVWHKLCLLLSTSDPKFLKLVRIPALAVSKILANPVRIA
jgi:hypothetical protein